MATPSKGPVCSRSPAAVGIGRIWLGLIEQEGSQVFAGFDMQRTRGRVRPRAAADSYREFESLPLRQSGPVETFYTPQPQAPRMPQKAELRGHSSESRIPVNRLIRAVFVSLGPLFPTQPNHGDFGTDVRSSRDQKVEQAQGGVGLKELRLGGAKGDRNCPMRYVRFGRPTRRSWRPNDKGARPGQLLCCGKILLVHSKP
jgi:hypothetical protein